MKKALSLFLGIIILAGVLCANVSADTPKSMTEEEFSGWFDKNVNADACFYFLPEGTTDYPYLFDNVGIAWSDNTIYGVPAKSILLDIDFLRESLEDEIQYYRTDFPDATDSIVEREKVLQSMKAIDYSKIKCVGSVSTGDWVGHDFYGIPFDLRHSKKVDLRIEPNIFKPQDYTNGPIKYRITIGGTALYYDFWFGFTKYPKVTKLSNDTNNVYVSGDALPEKVELEVINDNSDSVQKSKAALQKININPWQMLVYDISLLDESGVTKQPTGKIKVSLPVSDDLLSKYSMDEYFEEYFSVYYVDSAGVCTKMPITYKDGYITFETDHFSTYALVINKAEDTGSVKPTNSIKPTSSKSDIPPTGNNGTPIMFVMFGMLGVAGIMLCTRRKNHGKG